MPSIGLSLWGEPALHPDIAGLVSAALARPRPRPGHRDLGGGLAAGRSQADPTASRASPDLDRVPGRVPPRAVYSQLRGRGLRRGPRDGGQPARSSFPATTWVQAVRMKENEEDLESFYKSWKSRTGKVIIQKYDSFCGTAARPQGGRPLPCDALPLLAPPARLPHPARRDRAPVQGGNRRGSACWATPSPRTSPRSGSAERGAARSHLARHYPGLCARCDEYYTYNF